MIRSFFKCKNGLGLIEVMGGGFVLALVAVTVMGIQSRTIKKQKSEELNVKDKMGKISAISPISKLFSFGDASLPGIATIIVDPYIKTSSETQKYILTGPVGPNAMWGYDQTDKEITVYEIPDENIPEANFLIQNIRKDDLSHPHLITSIEIENSDDKKKLGISVENEDPSFRPTCKLEINGSEVTTLPILTYQEQFEVKLKVTGLLPNLPQVTVNGVRQSVVNQKYLINVGASYAPLSHRSILTANQDLDIWSAQISLEVPLCCGDAYSDTAGCYPYVKITALVPGVSEDVQCEYNLKGNFSTLIEFDTTQCTREIFLNQMSSNYPNFSEPKHFEVSKQYTWGQGGTLPLFGDYIVPMMVRKSFITETYDFKCQDYISDSGAPSGFKKSGVPYFCPYNTTFNNFTRKEMMLGYGGAYYPPGHPIPENTALAEMPIYVVTSTNGSNCEYKYCGNRNAVGCFLEGTKLILSNGNDVNIEDIMPGDKLYNPLTGGDSIVDYIVVGPEEKALITIHHEGGMEIVTQGHPFLTSNELKPAIDLKPGDMLFTKYGTTSVSFIQKSVVDKKNLPTVWNILVNRESNIVEDHMILTKSGLPSGDLFLQERFEDIKDGHE